MSALISLNYRTQSVMPFGWRDRSLFRAREVQAIVNSARQSAVDGVTTFKIPFNQYSDVIVKLNKDLNKTLFDFKVKYGGLCELICNRMLIDDVMGKGVGTDYLVKLITVHRLDVDVIKKSHLLKIYSIFWRIVAFLFSIYPDNIFSFRDQWKLVQKTSSGTKVVNRELLKKVLPNIQTGETLKFEVFRKFCCTFEGHSLLIKKVSDNNYIFFDPNSGEERGLDFDQLCNRIDGQIRYHSATDIAFIRGNDFLNRIL